MSGVFSQLDGDTVILFSKGVFKQADVYHRDRFLFARHAGGFIRLIAKGQTSVPHIVWEDLRVTEAEPFPADHGRMKF